ncbi:MAG: flagellar basal body protein [Planctomycetota bacterium]
MTLVDHVTNAGALPTLAQSIQFAAQRQTILSHNIANASTPRFQHKDVPPEAFQATLRDAVDERRERTGGQSGELRLRSSREIQFTDRGVRLSSESRASGGVLAHDRNNRDLESMMQDLTENLGAYRVATELMRTQSGTMRVAISERVG